MAAGTFASGIGGDSFREFRSLDKLVLGRSKVVKLGKPSAAKIRRNRANFSVQDKAAELVFPLDRLGHKDLHLGIEFLGQLRSRRVNLRFKGLVVRRLDELWLAEAASILQCR